MKIEKSNNRFFGLQFIATGAQTNGRYFMSKTIIPAADNGPPLHCHSLEDESFFVVKGILHVHIDGSDFELSEGEFLNIEKGKKHTWKNDTDEDVELIVTFAPAGIEHMFMELEKDSHSTKEIGLKYGTTFEL